MNMLHIRFPETFTKPAFNHVLLLAKAFEDTEKCIHTTTISEDGLVLKLGICGAMNIRSALSRVGISLISVRGKKFLKIEDGLSREYSYLPVEEIILNGSDDIKHILTSATFKEKVRGVFGLIQTIKPIKLNHPSVMVVELKKDDIPEELKALINAVKEEVTGNDFYSRPTEDELHGDEIKNTTFDPKPEPRKFMDSSANVSRTRVEASFDNNGDEIKNTTFDNPEPDHAEDESFALSADREINVKINAAGFFLETNGTSYYCDVYNSGNGDFIIKVNQPNTYGLENPFTGLNQNELDSIIKQLSDNFNGKGSVPVGGFVNTCDPTRTTFTVVTGSTRTSRTLKENLCSVIFQTAVEEDTHPIVEVTGISNSALDVSLADGKHVTVNYDTTAENGRKVHTLYVSDVYRSFTPIEESKQAFVNYFNEQTEDNVIALIETDNDEDILFNVYVK